MSSGMTMPRPHVVVAERLELDLRGLRLELRGLPVRVRFRGALEQFNRGVLRRLALRERGGATRLAPGRLRLRRRLRRPLALERPALRFSLNTVLPALSVLRITSLSGRFAPCRGSCRACAPGPCPSTRS